LRLSLRGKRSHHLSFDKSLRCKGKLGCDRLATIQGGFALWPDSRTSLQRGIRHGTGGLVIQYVRSTWGGRARCSATAPVLLTPAARIGKRTQGHVRHASHPVSVNFRKVASSARMARNPGRLVCVSMARHSRVCSLLMSARETCDRADSVSATKSIAQR
jgi:hypothetical protein